MLPRPKVEVIRLRPISLPSKRNAARKGQGIWRVASTVGPGPILKIGPWPKTHWTKSNNTSDQVQYTFGRGPIIPPGPGPTYTAYMPMEAIIAGPGPTLKIGPRPKTPWTRSNTHLGEVHYISGRGPIITHGPGPIHIAYMPMEAIIAGPGPTLKIGPRPKTHWTKSNNTSDQVQYTFGRGPIIPPGPGPPFIAYMPMEAIIAGPGPTLKIGPRPKTPWTKSNNTSDQVQRL